MKGLGFLKRKYIIVTAIILLVAVVSVSTVLLLRGEPGIRAAIGDNSAAGRLWANMSIEPTAFDSAGVDTGSGFRIASKEGLSLSMVKDYLKVQPEQAFSIKELSRSELILEFEKPLQADSIYRFTMDSGKSIPEGSWAFQTKKEFRVVRTLPRDQGTGVPVNSGIEITFSHEGIEKLDSFFEITPKIEGVFEYHKKTAVFVPKELAHNTIYTVKIKKGLGLKGSSEKIREDTVFKFQTQSPEDANSKNAHYFNFSQPMYNFTAKEVPAIEVYGDDYFKDKELTVDVYRYRDVNNFISDLKKYDDLPRWAVRSAGDIKFGKSMLDKDITFKAKIHSTDSPWYKQMLVFPDSMKEGHYLISVKSGEYEYNAHLQVNDLSVYFMLGRGKSIAWTNDSITGKPVSGVGIESEGVHLGKTDNEGIAGIEKLPEAKGESYCRIFKLTADGRPPFAAFVSESSNYYSNYYTKAGMRPAERYWSYLYLDRGMYLPDDTIRVWGLVKPRAAGKGTENVTVELARYTYSDYISYTSELSALKSKKLKLTPYGTFAGELEFENLNPGTYYIVLRAGEDTLAERYLEIRKYTKPAYKVEVKADRDECFLGEGINVDVNASFFEGSPVSGLKLDYNSYGGYSYRAYGGGPSILKSMNGQLVCGSDGHASLKYFPKLENGITAVDWKPVHANFSFNNAAAEEQNVNSNYSLLVFPRDIMIDAAGKISGNKFVFDFKTNSIDLDKYRKQKNNDSYNNASFEDGYKGLPIDTKINVNIYEKYWKAEEIGQYYDFINKVTRKRYKYNEVNNIIHKFEGQTVNGSFKYELPYDDFSRYKSYYMEVYGEDTKNKPIKFTEYIYYSNIYPASLEQMETAKSYTLEEENNKYKFRLGDKVSFKVLENYEEFKMPENGKVLCLTLKSGMVDYSVKGENSFSREFTEELIPNAFMKAVYFDGTNIYNAGEFALNYDYSERKLNIELKPDKDQYRPGDKVNIGVKVTDEDGKPCQAAVNLSVVDEAFFALRDQWVDTVAGVYSYAFDTGVYSDYFSYSPVNPPYPHAECGEGGDEALIRYDFKDNAYFGTAEADSKGQAQLSFTLPHNLTSWRLTCQGITKDLKAGDKRANINVKLPFFTTLIFNDIYLEGDSPGISLRSYGTGIKGSDNVKYEVVLESSSGYSKTFRKEGLANSFCNINMESLAAGDYTVTVNAAFGSYKDAVKKEFKVVKSVLETAITGYYPLTDSLNLSAAFDISKENSLTELVFYNKGLTSYWQVLNSLYWSWGERVDQVLARKIAGEFYKKYFDDGNKRLSRNSEPIDFKKFQTDTGGIALLSYDSASPELSAKVCSLAGDSFDTGALESYFINTIQNAKSTDEDVAASYWGLATLGKPILLDIRTYLKKDNISLKEKLYIGLALADLGDFNGAKEVYEGILKQYGKSVKGYYTYIDTGKDSGDITEMTALCGMIGLKINSPEKEELFSYVADKSTDDILLNLEKLIYLLSAEPEDKSTGSFVINIGGKIEEIKLKGIERYSAVLTYEQLKSIKFSDIKGNIEVAAEYIGPVNSLVETGNDFVKLTRTYSVKGKDSNSFKHSDIVQVDLKVELSDKAPDGYYQVTDVLPSGLRYIPPKSWDWDNWYLDDVNGQKVNFGYYYGNKGKKTVNIRYLARVAAPGKYTADNAIVKHAGSQFCSFTKRQEIEIGKE